MVYLPYTPDKNKDSWARRQWRFNDVRHDTAVTRSLRRIISLSLFFGHRDYYVIVKLRAHIIHQELLQAAEKKETNK